MRSSPVTMLLVFAVTLFLSALLLFLVQPMIGKMILPMLGGSPAVWNTCMVFFQAMLLAGYAYAHATTTWLGPRKQAGLHLIVMAVPFLVLPIAVNKALAPEGEANPVVGVLVLLTAAVGLPFFVVSASAPLLQKWFASTDHPAAKDPYFLYAASNLGSMLALAFYPSLIEPTLALTQQSWVWLAGYGVLLASTAICAILMWRSAPAPMVAGPVRGLTAIAAKPLTKHHNDEPDVELLTPAQRPVSAWRRLRWTLLAAVPSSLMLGATTYITTDIAAIALLWVLPLGLYLLSFILVFSRLPAWVHRIMILLMPLMVLVLAFMLLSHMTPKMWQYIAFHLAILFIVAMVCHGELARDRPAPAHLTEFFLWMSVGGVLGGLFNALLAPVLFNGIVEYQLALVLACLIMPPLGLEPGAGFGFKFDLAIAASLGVLAFAAFYIGMHHLRNEVTDLDVWAMQREADGATVPEWVARRMSRLQGDVTTMQLGQAIMVGFVLLAPLGWFLSRDPQMRGWWFDGILPTGLGLLAAGLLLTFYERNWEFETVRDWVRTVTRNSLNFSAAQTAKFLVFGLPALLCYIFVERPLRFGLAVGAFLLASGMYDLRASSILHQERSYFGVLKINEDTYRRNGLTYHTLTHGTTTHGIQCMDAEYRAEPLSYYHHNGPVGQLFSTYPELTRNYAVIGLGTGSMAAYGDQDHKVTFYEIDRHVREIAKDPNYFTFLTDYERRRGEPTAIVMGDARLQLEKANPAEKYGMILVDAFSSDAIPVHLITLDAVEMLFEKTAENGIVAFHISNRWLDLAPVLYHIARKLDLAVLIKHDSGDRLGGESEWYASTWVALARKPGYLKRLERTDWLASEARKLCLELSAWPGPSVSALATVIGGAGERPIWDPLLPKNQKESLAWEKVGIWTDDYSNVLSVFNWEKDEKPEEN